MPGGGGTLREPIDRKPLFVQYFFNKISKLISATAAGPPIELSSDFLGGWC
jgi:hypothetical protein